MFYQHLKPIYFILAIHAHLYLQPTANHSSTLGVLNDKLTGLGMYLEQSYFVMNQKKQTSFHVTDPLGVKYLSNRYTSEPTHIHVEFLELTIWTAFLKSMSNWWKTRIILVTYFYNLLDQLLILYFWLVFNSSIIMYSERKNAQHIN